MRKPFSAIVFVVSCCALVFNGALFAGDIVFENAKMRLVLGRDACAKSLIVKKTGEEMLVPGGRLLSADLVKGMRLKGGAAAVVAGGASSCRRHEGDRNGSFYGGSAPGVAERPLTGFVA